MRHWSGMSLSVHNVGRLLHSSSVYNLCIGWLVHTRKDSCILQIYLYSPSLPPSYIPALMAQARIYWEMDGYQQVEKVFRKSEEFCSEHDVWKLNVAHVLFLQVSKSQRSQVWIELGLA